MVELRVGGNTHKSPSSKSRLLRIAHVTATFPPYYGGTGMVCYYSALELARQGHEVTVITAGNPLGTPTRSEMFPVRRLKARFQVGNAPLLPGLLSLSEFDIIHLHHPFIFGAEMTWAASMARRIPFVFTHHNDLIGDGMRRYLFNAYSAISARLICRYARKLIVVSLDHARSCQLTPLFQRRWSDVVEIPNGVDTALFKPSIDGSSIRQRYGVPDDATVILFVGALDRAHHYRRVDLLIQAVGMIGDPGLHVLLVGDGDRSSQYRDLAAGLGLGNQVHFSGSASHQDLPSFYSAADLVVLPSQLQESFGLVLIEALACGKPVIASDLPGARSVVSNGRDGLLARPGDLDDLVDKIRILTGDPTLRDKMGAAGRQKVEERYDWRRIGERLEDLYFEALGV